MYYKVEVGQGSHGGAEWKHADPLEVVRHARHAVTRARERVRVVCLGRLDGARVLALMNAGTKAVDDVDRVDVLVIGRETEEGRELAHDSRDLAREGG